VGGDTASRAVFDRRLIGRDADLAVLRSFLEQAAVVEDDPVVVSRRH
jgi:hypothetical protein